MNKSTYIKKALERDSILFKWFSNSIKLPYNPEFILTTNGSLGFLINEQKWVVGHFDGITDEFGDFTNYIWHSLNTRDVRTGNSKNHDEIIVCGNTSLYRPFEEERRYYAQMKEETDRSILCQLINTRLNKAIVAMNDNQRKQILKAYKDVTEGYPMILVTSLLEDLSTIDLTDPKEIDKMQYLSAFFETLEKREANDFGVDLEVVEKRAQVNNAELNQYDDVTTLEFLIMMESRMRFVNEMKSKGFDIDIVRNPVFFDEPKEEDVEGGTFEAAEPEEPAEQEVVNEDEAN